MFTGKNMQDEALDSGIAEDDNNQSIVRRSRGWRGERANLTPTCCYPYSTGCITLCLGWIIAACCMGLGRLLDCLLCSLTDYASHPDCMASPWMISFSKTRHMIPQLPFNSHQAAVFRHIGGTCPGCVCFYGSASCPVSTFYYVEEPYFMVESISSLATFWKLVVNRREAWLGGGEASGPAWVC